MPGYTFDELKAEFPTYVTEEDRGLLCSDLLYRIATRMRDDRSTPSPSTPTNNYRVIGTVHYAGGFDMVVGGSCADDARQWAEQLIATEQYSTGTLDLQEVCINECYATADELSKF